MLQALLWKLALVMGKGTGYPPVWWVRARSIDWLPGGDHGGIRMSLSSRIVMKPRRLKSHAKTSVWTRWPVASTAMGAMSAGKHPSSAVAIKAACKCSGLFKIARQRAAGASACQKIGKHGP